MNITIENVDSLIGSETYREESIRAALQNGVSRLQTVKLQHNAEAELLHIEAPTFDTVLDLSKMSDPSVEALRERLDELLIEQMESYMEEVFR